VYAEGDTDDEAERLEREISEIVESIIESGEA
jgi:hypothetical protein